MPELAEIHKYANDINEWSSGKVFDYIEKQPSGKGPDVSLSVQGSFTLFAQARGKELQLTLTRNGKNPVVVTFSHGLVGGWAWSKSPVKFTHLYFRDTEQNYLCFFDANRLGSWKQGAFDTKTRGPDPITDFNAFRANIMGNLDAPQFKRKICETLLEQKFFNGIGNYLRAEILYRACVSPHVIAKELFTSNPEAANRILSLCRTVPLEVLNLKLNKYGTPQEKAEFEKWLKIYDKGTFDVIAGRKIFYDKNQHLRDPEKSESVIPAQSQAGRSKQTQEATSRSKTTAKQTQVKPPREYKGPREKNVKKVLLAVGMLWNLNKITSDEKTWIKESALKQNDLVFCVLEAFEGDADKDVDELADNFKVLYSLATTRDAFIA